VDRSTLRLFFALWPETQTRALLDRVARDVALETGGRAVAADNLHLTLAFLGERPAELIPRLSEIAAGVECAAFTLHLDDVGYWRKTGLAWLGTDAPSTELTDLQHELVRVLATLGMEQEARHFAPHVTLARRIGTIVRRRLPSPITWNVDSFSLVKSELGREGARYHVLETWPLRAGAR
jgi:2'-5' RNA ligase